MDKCLVVNTTNEPKTLSYRPGDADNITIQPKQHMTIDRRYTKKLPEGVIISEVEVLNAKTNTVKSKPAQNK